MLCSICTSCFATGNLESKLRSRMHTPLRHHETFETFSKSVDASCTVCHAIWRSIEDHGHSMRREKQPLTQFSLEARRNKAKRNTWSEFAKVVTIYWLEHGQRFQQQKAFSLELAKDIASSTGHSDAITIHCLANKNPNLLSQWLGNCINHHKICNSAHTFIPTRLLDVGKSKTHWNLRVTRGDSSDFCKYATLSHQWGSEHFLCLTSSNLEDLKTGMLLSVLSPTFQHAMAVTKELGIRYLWIDSLCIVQDSKEDWRFESARMSSVYNHSILTIAMLLTEPRLGRLPDDFSTVSSICHVEPRWTDIAPELYYIFEDSMWQNCVSSAPLNHRAWVLQERILSRRILYVHETQHFWECHEQTACEIFPLQMPPQMRCMPGRSAHKGARPNIEWIAADRREDNNDAYSFWRQVVERYTVCELTRAGDKLIALSGLAQRVAAITNDNYLAGLWARHLQIQLMWQVKDPPTGKFPLPVSHEDSRYRAPSWSWASIDGKAQLRSPDIDEDILSLIEIVSANVTTVTEDRTGQVQKGFIRVIGSLLSAAYHLDGSRSSGGRLVVAELGSSKEFNIFVDFDVHPNAAVQDLLCLPLYHYLAPEVDGRKGQAGVEGLVLWRNPTSDPKYYRVGIFAMHGRPLCQLADLDFRNIEEGLVGKIAIARSTQLVVIA